MGERSRVSYEQEMRDRAKKDGKTLGSVDAEFGGTRFTYQGPTTRAQAKFLMWCGVMAMTVDEEDLPDMRRMVERRKRKREQADGE